MARTQPRPGPPSSRADQFIEPAVAPQDQRNLRGNRLPAGQAEALVPGEHQCDAGGGEVGKDPLPVVIVGQWHEIHGATAGPFAGELPQPLLLCAAWFGDADQVHPRRTRQHGGHPRFARLAAQ